MTEENATPLDGNYPDGSYTLTHGLPGSGKSTWAEEEVARIRAAGGKAVRINRDDIRTRLFGEGYHKQKKFQQSDEQQVTDVQNQLIQEHLSKGFHVLNDDTNLNQRFLSGHLLRAREHGVPLVQKHFDVPVDECKRRNQLRAAAGGRLVPDHVIDKMAKSAYGADGRIKEFRIGERTSFAYDRAGVKGEADIAAYELRQQKKYGKPKGGVLFLDMDGSAVDVREIADKYMGGPKRNYHAFHNASEFSPENPEVMKIVREAVSNDIPIVITTARSSDYVKPTVAWLENHDVPAVKLFMRKSADGRKDYEVKPEFIEEAAADGMFPLFAIEDNPGAIQGWKEHGVEVVEVPYYSALPLESAEEADAASGHTEAEENAGEKLVDSRSKEERYPTIMVESPFRAGWCVRCGSKLKDSSKTIGDRCRTKA